MGLNQMYLKYPLKISPFCCSTKTDCSSPPNTAGGDTTVADHYALFRVISLDSSFSNTPHDKISQESVYHP